MKQDTSKEDFSSKNLFYSLTTVKAIFIIVIIGVIVFFNSLFNGFVWDDRQFILNNTDIHTYSISKMFGPSLFNAGSYYRPLTAIYFTFMYSIANDSPFLYHFVQISLHITCAILLFIFLKYFLDKSVALFLAIIFLIHPMNVESVSYISASGGMLLTCTGLLALLILQQHKLNGCATSA